MSKRSKTEYAKQRTHTLSPGTAAFRQHTRDSDAWDIAFDPVVQLDGESCSGSEDDRDVMAALSKNAQQRLVQEERFRRGHTNEHPRQATAVASPRHSFATKRECGERSKQSASPCRRRRSRRRLRTATDDFLQGARRQQKARQEICHIRTHEPTHGS